MLHILWLILKIILIILAVVLGILLLCLLLILFCPVRYRASASKAREASFKEAEAQGCVTWLFRALMVSFALKEGKVSTSVKIFGISLDRLLRKGKKTSVKKKKEPDRESAGIPESGKPEEEPPAEVLSIEERKDIEPVVEEQKAAGPEEQLQALPEKATDPEDPEPAAKHSRAKKENPVIKLLRKLFALPGKLRDKYLQVRKKSRQTLHKAGWYKDFALHPKTREAISLLIREVKFLIRHIMPTKIEGNVLFGSEDPSITGKVLAFLGISIPFHRNRIAVTPDFSCENVLAGEVKLKGRIYGAAFAGAAIKILINRSVWNVIRRFKRKEGYANAE
ncbi:MAG: DUF2953 domain-containing protein [Blautia sp.]|nr:DUF2953 domain-containing protein [Blautia sp.]